MTAYHVGDIAGILGLLVAFFGLWLTFKEARAAKEASGKAASAAEQAREAAQQALRDRDRVEVAGNLGELCSLLRELREQTQTDDWGQLSHLFDRAASLTMRLLAAESQLTGAERVMVENLRTQLRKCQMETNGFKDASKQRPLKKRLYADLMALFDASEAAQTKRLKRGPTQDREAG